MVRLECKLNIGRASKEACPRIRRGAIKDRKYRTIRPVAEEFRVRENCEVKLARHVRQGLRLRGIGEASGKICPRRPRSFQTAEPENRRGFLNRLSLVRGGFPHFQDRGHKQDHEDGYDGDDHQEFDERKRLTTSRSHSRILREQTGGLSCRSRRVK